MQQRGPPERRDLVLVAPSFAAASATSCAHFRLWPAMNGDFRSMKSAATASASSSSAPSRVRCGSGSRSSTASQGSDLGELLEPTSPCVTKRSARSGSYVLPLRSRAASSASRRDAAADRLHVVAEVHDAHGERDLLTLGARRVAVPVPPLVGEAERVPGRRPRTRAAAPAGRPPRTRSRSCGPPTRGAPSWIDRAICSCSSGSRPAVANATIAPRPWPDPRCRAPASRRGGRRRRRRRWRSRARGPCIRRSAAARPSRRSSRTVLVEARLLAQRHAEEARAELRLERLPERVVLRQRERRGEFTQAERADRMGNPPDAAAADGTRLYPPPSRKEEGQGGRRAQKVR